jgi:hypothetical protein
MERHWFDLVVAPPEVTSSDYSHTSITPREMRVNAGLHHDNFYIRAVRRKVRVYGGLNKAELCSLGARLVALA